MLVEPVAANLSLHGYEVVMMGEGVGYKQLTNDIHRGVLKVANYTTIVVVMGRAEALGHQFGRALNKLVQALCTFGRDTTFVLVGPLPKYSYDKRRVRDLLHAGTIMKRKVQELNNFRFCDASAWFADRHGSVQKYVNRSGITKAGYKVISDRIKAVQ